MGTERELLEALAGITSGSGADLTQKAIDNQIEALEDRRELADIDPVEDATADIVVLTDNSTGTSGGNTVGAVSDGETAADAVATLTAKINAIIPAVNMALDLADKVDELINALTAYATDGD
jgi:hypothetical protein